MLDSVQHTDPAQNTPDVNPLRQQSLTHDLDRHCYGKRSWQQGRALGRSLTDGSGLAGSGVIPGRDPAGDRRRAGPRPCCAPSELPRLRQRLPGKGLSPSWRRDAVRPGHGLASLLSLCRMWRDRSGRGMAIARPLDPEVGSTAGASLRVDDRPDGHRCAGGRCSRLTPARPPRHCAVIP